MMELVADSGLFELPRSGRGQSDPRPRERNCAPRSRPRGERARRSNSLAIDDEPQAEGGEDDAGYRFDGPAEPPTPGDRADDEAIEHEPGEADDDEERGEQDRLRDVGVVLRDELRQQCGEEDRELRVEQVRDESLPERRPRLRLRRFLAGTVPPEREQRTNPQIREIDPAGDLQSSEDRRRGGQDRRHPDGRRERPAEQTDENPENRLKGCGPAPSQAVPHHQRHVRPRCDRQHEGHAAERQDLSIEHATVVSVRPWRQGR